MDICLNNNIPTRKQPAEESPAKLFKCYNGGLSVGKQISSMSNITRDVLIKAIVADKMKSCDGIDYTQTLKSLYHEWGHASSQELCDVYNKIRSTNLTVDVLVP